MKHLLAWEKKTTARRHWYIIINEYERGCDTWTNIRMSQLSICGFTTISSDRLKLKQGMYIASLYLHVFSHIDPSSQPFIILCCFDMINNAYSSNQTPISVMNPTNNDCILSTILVIKHSFFSFPSNSSSTLFF